MSKLHNFPRTEVGHVSVLDGAFAGTVTKTFNCLAGLYQVAIAYSCASVSSASAVQIKPFADEDQAATGTAIDIAAAGGTADGTVTIATGTNAEVEWTQTDVFLPFGAQIVFSTTSATGTGSIDVFFRTEG